MSADTQGISTLKELLFEEERKKYSELSSTIEELQAKIDADLEARKRPDAEISLLVEQISEIMPEKMGPAITETLKVQIRESKDDMVQALFPIIGQMVKKYVQSELKTLSEKIDRQLESAFSLELIVSQIKAFFLGSGAGQVVLKEALEAHIEEVFIVEEESGLLLASYSKKGHIDQDIVAGMLTAIRSFVEDAFDQGEQKLESITYDQYDIYLQSFNKFYIAVVISGVADAGYKSKLDDTLLSFVKEMTKRSLKNDEQLTEILKKYFESL